MTQPDNQPKRPFWRPQFVSHGLWSRFDLVKELAWDMESSMKSKIKDLDERASRLSEVEDEEYRSHLSDTFSDEYYSYTKEWIPVIRESILLSICSSFEYHLGRLCDSYGSAYGTSFKIKDLNDRGITRCRTYFLRVGVSEVAFGVAWNRLNNIYKVRNRIAHAGSISDETTQSALRTEPDIFDLSDTSSRKIKITEDGIEKICDLMAEALRNLNSELFAPIKT